MRVGDGEGFQRRLGQASCLGGLAPVAGVGEKPGCARRVVDDRDFEERVSRALAAEQLLGEEGDLVDAVHLLYSVVVTTGPSAAEAHQAAEATGVPEAGLEASVVVDPYTTVRQDVEQLRNSPFLSPKVSVSGHVYDIATGRVTTTVDALSSR